MRILFVAMPESIHTARWINQLSDQNWDIHLFPSIDSNGVHPALRRTFVHIPVYGKQLGNDPSVHFNGFRLFSPIYSRELAWQARRVILEWWPNYYVQSLIRLIRRLKPDIIHSLEFQHAGYLTLSGKRMLGASFPAWITSSWGSDLYLFGRLEQHRSRVKDVLMSCDYYLADCERDVQLAKQMGLQGEVLSAIPVGGGYNIGQISQYQCKPPSSRKTILLKGYQGIFGRSLVGLQAISRCADVLRGYKVKVYLASEDVSMAAELASHSFDIPIEIVQSCSHEEMLQLLGKARIHIGLSISDGTPQTLLEAMIMGAFPIQSDTSCANEWVEDGVSGLIVPPEDPEIIAQALRRALTDDVLVDRAAERNALVCTERLEYSKVQAQAIGFYERVFADSAKSGPAGR